MCSNIKLRDSAATRHRRVPRMRFMADPNNDRFYSSKYLIRRAKGHADNSKRFLQPSSSLTLTSASLNIRWTPERMFTKSSSPSPCQKTLRESASMLLIIFARRSTTPSSLSATQSPSDASVPRILMSFKYWQDWKWTATPEKKFAEEFAKVYRKANGK